MAADNRDEAIASIASFLIIKRLSLKTALIHLLQPAKAYGVQLATFEVYTFVRSERGDILD